MRMCEVSEAMAFTTKAIDKEDAGEIQLQKTSPSLMSGTGEKGNMLPRVLIPLTSSAEVSPAKTLASPDAGLGFLAPEADSSMSLPESWARYVQSGYSWKMFQGFYPQTGVTISASSSTPFRGSGMAFRGEYLTQDTSESPSAAVESTLSEVLETSVPQRFYLSPKAAAGILRRAERRGKKLPRRLEQALQVTAGGATT